jgi:hypothetical protein
MACGSDVDNVGGVCKQGWGLLYGCNATSSDGYIISIMYRCEWPYGSGTMRVARGSCERVGDEIGGVAPHHVGGGRSDLMAFARIETCSTDVADIFADTTSPAVYPMGIRGDGRHFGCIVNGRRDGCSWRGLSKGKFSGCEAGE